MRLLTVRHATTYRYRRMVTFGQHRLMLRPRDSHDLRLVGADLTLSPPGKLRWMHDVFGNSVALVDFQAAGDRLSIASTLRIERFGAEGLEFPIAPVIGSISAACSSSITWIPMARWRAGPTVLSPVGQCRRGNCLLI